MYNKAKDIIKIANEKNLKIYDIVILKEVEISEKSVDELRERMRYTLKVMMESANFGLENETKSVGGLLGGDSKKIEEYRKKGKTICGDTVNRAMARAMSTLQVNATMGKIVAAPTAGSSGIVPAAVITAAEVLGADEEAMINALFTASGVGQVIVKNATVAGAEGGCQAETGSAAAMAAAAIVEMAGGTPEMSFHAGAIAIKNVLGLVCDPIAGLVEAPCAKRNSSGVMNALTSADLALAGVESVIPFDEVVDAMYKVGRVMPEALRETALGGLAATPTGIEIRKRVFGY
jgi:L-serine dehydratase